MVSCFCFERIILNLFSNPTTEFKFRILGLTDICKPEVFPNYSHLVRNRFLDLFYLLPLTTDLSCDPFITAERKAYYLLKKDMTATQKHCPKGESYSLSSLFWREEE